MSPKNSQASATITSSNYPLGIKDGKVMNISTVKTHILSMNIVTEPIEPIASLDYRRVISVSFGDSIFRRHPIKIQQQCSVSGAGQLLM